MTPGVLTGLGLRWIYERGYCTYCDIVRGKLLHSHKFAKKVQLPSDLHKHGGTVITKRMLRIAQQTLKFPEETIRTIGITGMRRAEAKWVVKQHRKNQKAKHKLKQEMERKGRQQKVRAEALCEQQRLERRIVAREAKQITHSAPTKQVSAECQANRIFNTKVVQGGLPGHGRRK